MIGMVERLFYDGHCGLCHRSVSFVLHHDPAGRAFRFAPLGGPTFLASLSAAERAGLPDSIVVQTSDGRLLVRSRAAAHVLRRLGGGWKVLGGLVLVVPRPVADFVYDLVARIRHRLFARPVDVCPLMPPELRGRFDP
ncbi:MAG: DCC1-like thiol-disulfide oxidoreductase family protein [Thermoanaerobaculia bacterium]|nr:DCC1-like thiol-disulfide oxidoreductase family protein [Thermoanaerobaculia bacterium]